MGVMVSAVFDEWRGFGLQLTDAEITLVNDTREAAAILDGQSATKKNKYRRIPWINIFSIWKWKR